MFHFFCYGYSRASLQSEVIRDGNFTTLPALEPERKFEAYVANQGVVASRESHDQRGTCFLFSRPSEKPETMQTRSITPQIPPTKSKSKTWPSIAKHQRKVLHGPPGCIGLLARKEVSPCFRVIAVFFLVLEGVSYLLTPGISLL